MFDKVIMRFKVTQNLKLKENRILFEEMTTGYNQLIIVSRSFDVSDIHKSKF